jgi:hypothetical protein
MKYLILIFTLIITTGLTAKDTKGTTFNLGNIPYTISLENYDNKSLVPIDIVSPDISNTKIPEQDKLLIDESWLLLDSINLHSYIKPKGNLGVRFYPAERFLHKIGFWENKPQEVIEALAKAPEWIRLDLENTLSLIPENKQIEYAELINKTNDPYIDEVAFAIAHTSPAFLVSSYCYKELFIQNAMLIYRNDSSLDYVEVVDYGNSGNDENYYTTTKYWRINSEGEKVQVEVPKDIYYWYIVHPKVSDEIPTYVKPSYIECNPDGSNHTLNIKSPENGGVFWRDFLFNYTEERLDTHDVYYPVLKDELAGCDILWDDTDENQSAPKIITAWINDVMDFTSKTERPHQPVRIYSLHIGRCGEHEDLTNATARTCLIPCRGIATISTDHVWNEFWDEVWDQWEPVNNSYKNRMAYKNRKYGSVFARRSNGVVDFVTKLYEKTGAVATINLYVNDKNDKPIDGAVVIMFVRNLDNPNSANLDSYTITDNEGKAQFIVGTTREFFCRILTECGNIPTDPNSVALIKSFPDSGATYNFSIKAAGEKDIVHYNTINPPADDVEDFVLQTEFTVQEHVINWDVIMDDFNNYYSLFRTGTGKLNFFITDTDNFDCCEQESSFDAVYVIANSVSQTPVIFNVPSEMKAWTAYLNNGYCTRNFNILDATFKLYASPDVRTEEYVTDGVISNYKVLPTPFSDYVNINFTLNEPCQITIDIFNGTGEKVKTIFDDYKNSGEYNVQWFGDDLNGNQLSSGIYFYQINTGTQRISNKLVLIR